MEEWRVIPGFELYEVSNIGNVRRIGSAKNRKFSQTKFGYFRCSLRKYGKNKWKFVHDLVLMAFVPNPDNLPHCDHINTIKTDNRVENLRWTNPKENMNNPLTIAKMEEVHARGETHQYSMKNPNRMQPHNTGKNGQQSNVYYLIRCVETGKVYGGAEEAQRETGVNSGAIIKCCHHMKHRKTAGGYHWEFASGKQTTKKTRQ